MSGFLDFLNPFANMQEQPRGNWLAQNKTTIFVVLAALNVALGLAVTMKRGKKATIIPSIVASPSLSKLPASASPNGR